MDKINFENLPSTNTPLDADILNGMQSNIEKSVVAVGKTQPSTSEKVWIKKGKNLFDKNNVLNGYRFGSDGALYADSDFSATDYIKVNSSTQYTVSWNIMTTQCVCYYNENKTFISRNTSEKSFTTPNNCKYIRASVLTESINSAQIEQGTSETTYEPYIGKEILVKNNNGVFEKFYDEFDITVEETSYQVVWNNEPYTFNFKKYGKIVTLQVLAVSSTDINGIPITTIPERFRPAFELSFAVLGYGALIGTAWLTTEGKLHLKTSAGNMVRIMITYVTK